MNDLFYANSLFLKGRHKEAFNAYMQILKSAPDAIVASNIGYMYHRGIAVARNYNKAMAFYNAAREEDGGVSCFNMALMYLRGQGVEIDFKRAIALMTRSAKLGCADARLYLGLAYILGYVYDPSNIECISHIPFYCVIYRDASELLLEGDGYDPALEDKRYEAIEADGEDAVGMYRELLKEHGDDPYTEKQCGAAQLMLGMAYIEGLGDEYDPSLGYKKIYRAAICYESAEAAQYLLANAGAAKAYDIDVGRIEMLSRREYFCPITGRLGTPPGHRINLLLPEERDNET